VWVVPVVAAIIAGWLGYRALIERGPTITISFPSADGSEADRATIRYKNVEPGRVTAIGLTSDVSRRRHRGDAARGRAQAARRHRILGSTAADNPKRHYRADHDRLGRV
jgi:hypothetical protein